MIDVFVIIYLHRDLKIKLDQPVLMERIRFNDQSQKLNPLSPILPPSPNRSDLSFGEEGGGSGGRILFNKWLVSNVCSLWFSGHDIPPPPDRCCPVVAVNAGAAAVAVAIALCSYICYLFFQFVPIRPKGAETKTAALVLDNRLETSAFTAAINEMKLNETWSCNLFQKIMKVCTLAGLF